MKPNPDIPKDWNIIHFPLNPLYIKQVTLDGKVGVNLMVLYNAMKSTQKLQIIMVDS